MSNSVKVSRQSDEAIRTYLKEVGADGHGIYKPEYLVKMGFEVAFVAKYTVREKSGKSYKSQLFDNSGNPVPYIDGVYALSFLYGIAENIGADTSEAMSKMGRGFQAQCLCSAISKVLPAEVPAVPEVTV